IAVRWRQLFRPTGQEQPTRGGQSGEDRAAAGGEAAGIYGIFPKGMGRSWRFKPELKTITTCTSRNSTKATAAKKRMGGGGGKPPNGMARKGREGVPAGDIARPVSTASGSAKKTTPQ